MKRPTYLQGVIDAERLYKEREDTYNTVASLSYYLDEEMLITDYRWGNWEQGFSDYIEFVKVKGILPKHIYEGENYVGV